jgi:hypothetical protein
MTTAKPTNMQTNERGLACVVQEITKRGGQAQTVREGRQIQVRAHGLDRRREISIQVKARTSGDWQTSTDRGAEAQPESAPTRFWILVDLQDDVPDFYVMPEWWIRNNIYDTHRAYIEAHGGHRVMNDESTHHRIETTRVAQWRDRWDVLGIV